jgi:hypothetical protein
MRKEILKTGFALTMGLAISAYAADICSINESALRGEAHRITGQQTGTISGTGYNFELWSADGTYSMTFYDNGTFKAEWSDTWDYVARVGIRSDVNNAYKTGNYTVDFKFTKSGNTPYGYIGVHGLTEEPQAEYFIVDDWFGEINEAYIGPKLGEYELDDAKYSVHAFLRDNVESWTGISTYVQYFAVREAPRQCGTISASAHLRKLDELFTGQTETLPTSRNAQKSAVLKLGKVFEIAASVEVGEGATGSVDFTYLRVGTWACCGPEESSSSSGSVAPESSEVAPESSSATPISSNVSVESSSSVTQELKPAAKSSELTAGIMQMAHISSFDRNLVVFDMQGRILGKLTVPAGMALNSAIFAKFGRPGIYMVQSDGVFKVLSVTK